MPSDEVLMPDGIHSLGEKIKSGAAWLTFAAVLSRGLQFLSELVLARLLAPDAFGLLAVGLSVVRLTEGTTSTGFDSALIQRQHITQSHLNAAWVTELVRNLILGALLFFLAPTVADFLQEPRASDVLRVFTLAFLLNGTKNIGAVLLRRELDFKKQFLLDSLPLLGYVGLVIPLALVFRNVWALVVAVLARRLLTVIASYALHPYRPGLKFRIEAIKELVGFGQWIFGLSLLAALRLQGTVLFVGVFFGVTMLGYFNRAEVLSTFFFMLLAEVLWKLGYPVFSLMQRDVGELRRKYMGGMYLAVAAGAFGAAALVALGDEIVRVVLTPEWAPSGEMVKWLSLVGFTVVAGAPAGILLQAVGKPAFLLKVALAELAVIAVAAIPASRAFGLSGFIGILGLTGGIRLFVLLLLVQREIGGGVADYLLPLGFAVTNAIVTFTIVDAVHNMVMHNSVNVWSLGVLLVSGGCIFIGIASLGDKYLKYGARATWRELSGASPRA